MNDCASERSSRHFERFATMLQRRGAPIDRPGIKMLDFGCGGGELVKSAYLRGIDAYGCDISFESDWSREAMLIELKAANRVRLVQGVIVGNVSPTQGDPYRLP